MRGRTPHRILNIIISSIVLLAALAGCSPDPRATVIVDTPVGDQAGNVTIDFTLVHRSEDLVNLEVIYSTNGGVKWRPAEIIDPDTSTKGLASSEHGVSHSLEWDTVADGVGSTCSSSTTRVHILPVTAAEDGRPDTTDDFVVNNGLSTAPLVQVTTPAMVRSGEIPIQYTLTDPEGDPATIDVEYSTDGGASYAPALPASASEPTVDLLTAPTGTAHSFTWDSVGDVGFGLFSQVRMRIHATDGTTLPQCEDTQETEDFRVDNSSIVPRLFVTNPGTGDLTEVNTNTGVLSTIPTPATSPHSIAVVRLPQGTYLMVTDTAGARVVVLDAVTGAVETQLPVQGSPKGIAVARVDVLGSLQHRAYVANSASDSVTILDAETFSFSSTTHLLAAGLEPTGVVAASVLGGVSIFVTLAGENAVLEIDGNLGAIIGTIPLDPRDGERPGPIAVAEGFLGPFLYVGSMSASRVSVIDASFGTVLGSALLGVSFPTPEGITSMQVPGGRTLALVSCSGDGSVRAIDVDGGHTLYATVQRAAQDPRGIVALRTQFGSRAYVVDSATGELGQIDLDDLDATGSTFPLPAIPGLGAGILGIASSR